MRSNPLMWVLIVAALAAITWMVDKWDNATYCVRTITGDLVCGASDRP